MYVDILVDVLSSVQVLGQKRGLKGIRNPEREQCRARMRAQLSIASYPRNRGVHFDRVYVGFRGRHLCKGLLG